MQPSASPDATPGDTHDTELARLRRENELLRAELAAARQGPGGGDPERFHWLADHLPAIVWRADAAGEVEFLNLAWVLFTGASAAESITRGFATYVHPEDLPVIAARRDASLVSGAPAVFEYRLRRADGVYRWHLGRLVPEKDAAGTIVRWYGTSADVHALLEADAGLKAAEERARAIIEQAMFSVQILGPDGRTRFVNRAWEELWGLTLADLQAIDYDMRVDPQLAEKGLLPYILRGFAGEALAIPTVRYETEAIGLKGTTRHVRAFIYPVRDAAGEVREVVLMHEDVTAAAEAEGALHEANRRLAEQAAALEAEIARRIAEADRAKDEFLSVISHELRTPLNFITGFASILEDEVRGALNAGQHEAVAKILAGADRMLLLVDDLLDFAKMQAGHLDLEPLETAYAPLLDEVLGQLAPLADRRGVTLAAEVAPDLLARADGPRVAQVLTNLVGNALKFTEAGGRVTVRAEARAGAVYTEVVDTGRGIAPEDQGKLFRRFQQLDMSRTRAAGGTGLGLAISKAIVEGHGGAIGVESAPGRGSTFWFTLPAG